jgi:hypothetical protein
MIEYNLNTGVETSRRIAADSALASSAIKPLVNEWVEAMAKQETLNDQQAATGSAYEQVAPEGSTPDAILRGEFGADAQQKFPAGALAAVDYLLTVQLDSADKSKS